MTPSTLAAPILLLVGAVGFASADDAIREHPPYEPADVAPADVKAQDAWKGVPPGLYAAFGSTDVRYPRHLPPQPAGDCFLVYPGARSSIRWERLREGIVDYEKIRIVRERLKGRAELAELDEALARFTFAAAQREPAADAVAHARAVLDRLSRVIAE